MEAGALLLGGRVRTGRGGFWPRGAEVFNAALADIPTGRAALDSARWFLRGLSRPHGVGPCEQPSSPQPPYAGSSRKVA